MTSTFEMCVKRTNKNGVTRIRCLLGLWEVSGVNALTVENEARRLWARSSMDGEYDKLLFRRGIRPVLY